MKTVELDGVDYDTNAVVKALKAQVTPERYKRIENVVSGRTNHLVPVLENIYDRGNTSAVMRSAEAFGFHRIHHIVGIDEFKESKRVTKGADKWLVQKQWPSTEPCIQDLRDQGYKIYVTHLEGGRPIGEVSFDEPVALCFGSERDGASSEITNLADERVYVPMQGFVQSFNISVAAALCFQTAHQAIASVQPAPLSDIERQWLTALYLYRGLKNPKLEEL